MIFRIAVLASVSLAAASAQAQESPIEVSGFGGYAFSEGIDVQDTGLGQIIDQVDVKSGFLYGFTFGVFVTEQAEVEFQFTQQSSGLTSGGLNDEEFLDMDVNNYHVNFVYNWGESDSARRPFLFAGLGATQFSPADIDGISIDSETRFSGTVGGGLKLYPQGGRFGVKLLARWTPTYIKSDPAGVWCSPYWPWGCYVLEDTDYANQFALVGGVTVRF